MAHAIRLYETGGPEKLRWEEVEPGNPGPGEVRVRNTAIGVNYVDIYHRNGPAPAPLPVILGVEGAGVVEAIGPGIGDFNIGDRVAYANPLGSYAEVCLRPVVKLVKIPPEIDDRVAAAILLKGMTAWYLISRTYRVKPGDTILMHAAAGGVGMILCQWATSLGATVIGTVGREGKIAAAREAGCKHVIVTSKEKWVERVKSITEGKGVPVVYDGVGKDTFMESFDCLAPLGMLVNFGNASGAVTSFNPAILAQKGSLFLTRPTLFHHTGDRENLLQASRDVFSALERKAIKISINHTYPLREAAQAHRDLESRKTTGSIVLVP